MSKRLARARHPATLRRSLRARFLAGRKPTPSSGRAGKGSQRAEVWGAPPPVMATEPAPSEQVGGVAAAVMMLHTRFTVPVAPVDETVTVEVPLEPRLTAAGEIAPTDTVNAGAPGAYFTTKASRHGLVAPQLLV